MKLRFIWRQYERQPHAAGFRAGGLDGVDQAVVSIPHLRRAAAGYERRARLRELALVEEEIEIGVLPGPVRVLDARRGAVQSHVRLGKSLEHGRGNPARGLAKGETQVRRARRVQERLIDNHVGVWPTKTTFPPEAANARSRSSEARVITTEEGTMTARYSWPLRFRKMPLSSVATELRDCSSR